MNFFVTSYLVDYIAIEISSTAFGNYIHSDNDTDSEENINKSLHFDRKLINRSS